MVRAGILTNDEDRIAQIKVFERNRSLAKTQRLFHAGAAGFMTHVRTVRQIVRAEVPDEQLIKKSGFVAGAARCVKDRLVGRSERIQFVGDQRERISPDRKSTRLK